MIAWMDRQVRWVFFALFVVDGLNGAAILYQADIRHDPYYLALTALDWGAAAVMVQCMARVE